MDYKELLKGVEKYANNNLTKLANGLYEEDWGDYFVFFEDNRPLIDRVDEFLKRWNKRVPADREKLRTAIEEIDPKFHNLNIVDEGLEDHHKEITRIFKDFIKTGKSRNNYIGAGKALHIFNPMFFPLWDSSIRHSYGCCENEEGYFNFMLRSQKEIFEIRDTYLADFNSDALDKLSSKIYAGRPKPILKLLDEYNYAKYTEGWI